MASCLNCGSELAGSYCQKCGQRNPIKRIGIVSLWNDFLSRIMGFDGMFPRTIRDLTLRPGRTSQEYINGLRVKYYGPLGYLFIMITVFLLLGSILGIDIAEFTLASTRSVVGGSNPDEVKVSVEVILWLIDNLRLFVFFFSIATVPFLWLFFKKSGLNLMESAVLVFYTNGHVSWLLIFSLLCYSIMGWAIDFNIIFLVMLVYLMYAFVDLYRYQVWWKVLLKGFAVFLLSNAFVLLLFSFGYVLLNK